MIVWFVIPLFVCSFALTALLAPKPELPGVDWSLPTQEVRTGLFGAAHINTETTSVERCGYCSSKVRHDDINCQNCGAAT